ncbi:thioesterase family protein [Fodinicola acaciae]|uniref:thioesterase family protein n=1 Tax=Fodinicola acaciae TaxID=2681555 RepID=UPI001C9E1F11|nr:thioesterase family protein [Fodinicola acaciae]
MTDVFYEALGDGRFRPTAATTSPWDQRMQHGGPPSALLATEICRVAGGADRRIGRITVDFLAPIPRSDAEVHVEVIRPGRRTQLAEATMTVDGRVAVVARAWQIATTASVPPTTPQLPPPRPGTQPQTYFPGLTDWGYGEATDWRFVSGGWQVPGPSQVWALVGPELVAGADPALAGLQRLLVLADSANGLAAEMFLDDWLFIPPTLTVTLFRYPASDWIFLASQTYLAPDGGGMSEARLYDQTGFLGTASQALYVGPRG